MAGRPRTPSPPSIVEPNGEGATANAYYYDHSTPRSSPSHFLLRPRSSSSHLLLRPPSVAVMGAPDDLDTPTATDGDSSGSSSAGGDPSTTVASSAPPITTKNPFNFQTQFISTAPVNKAAAASSIGQNIGQRRGHRYKHSSVSAQHQIFQEPPPRPPPVLPASLPVPTLREAWASMQREQRARLYWCLCHAAVAVYVFFSAGGSLAMTALSHLVFFDVGSAAVCVAVDVLGNFEVWRRSSVRHPFGLRRAEVLAGFAMSVFLVFGGFDLLSHNLKHLLESVGGHEPHTAHEHPHAHAHTHDSDSGSELLPSGHHHPVVNAGAVDLASLAAAASTLVSAYGLRNHARISRVMRRQGGYLASLLPGVLANPFHFLTLFFSFLMLLLPLLSVATYVWLDRLLCAAIAVSMFVLGTRLAVAQGLMLLMSYSSPRPPSFSSSLPDIKEDKAAAATVATTSTSNSSSVSAVVRAIEAEPGVARVEEAQFWQVHYGLGMANLKVRLGSGGSGCLDDGALAQLRARVARLVQNRLGEAYGGAGGGLRWEVTMQTSADVS